MFRKIRRLTRRFRRVSLLVGFLLFACFLFPRESSFEVTTLREGYPAKRDLIAPFQFYLLKDRDKLHREQALAARRIAPVFSVDESVESRVKTSLDSLRAQTENPAQSVRAVERLRSMGISREAMRVLTGPEGRRVATVAVRIADRAYSAGLLSEREAARAETDSPVAGVERGGVRLATPWGLLYDVATVRDLAWTEGQAAFPSRPGAAQALQELASAVIEPNLRYEASTTEALRAQAREGVNPYDGVVQKDEKIIGSHEIARPGHLRKLQSLRAANERVHGAASLRNQIPGLFGRAALIAFLLFGFLGYLKLHHRSVYADTSMLLLLAILTAAVMGAGWVIVNQIRGYEMLIPITVLSLTVAVLFGQELAFVTTLVASLLVAAVFGLGLPFLTGSAIAGIAAIATAAGVRRRRDFYLPMLIVAVAYAFANGAMGLVDGARLDILLRRMAWGVAAGFGSVLLVTLLLPLLETLFSVTTDITLLELADLNRPVLRKLMLEAPGTYHHSLVVGSLSEAGAEAVYVTDSAGALLPDQVAARVTAVRAALPGDIGVGFHGHMNLSLGLANSLAAVAAGATWIDGATCGMGAGAGNTPTEILAAVLDKAGIATGIDVLAAMDAAEDVVRPILARPPVVDRSALILGYAGVYSSFLLHAERAARRFGVPEAEILLEVGRRKAVGGQEDLIIEVAAALADSDRSTAAAVPA